MFYTHATHILKTTLFIFSSFLLFMPGQLSEYCQPEILHYHQTVLPIVFQALEVCVARLATTYSRIPSVAFHITFYDFDVITFYRFKYDPYVRINDSTGAILSINSLKIIRYFLIGYEEEKKQICRIKNLLSINLNRHFFLSYFFLLLTTFHFTFLFFFSFYFFFL